jgi:hypothetical protein
MEAVTIPQGSLRLTGKIRALFFVDFLQRLDYTAQT